MPTVDLVLMCEGVGNLVFEMPEEFSTGYTNQYKESGRGRQTHPRVIIWKSGAVNDFSVTLDLVVGVQKYIDTPLKLLGAAEMLRNMALPARRSKGPVAVTVAVKGGGGHWFSTRAYLISVKESWGPPYDVSTGLSMRCKVSLTFKPVYPSKNLPRRAWQFARQAGGRV